MILNEEETMALLKQTGLITDSEIANLKGFLCRTIHCVQPIKGFYRYKRNRSISRDMALSFSQEGQNIIKISALRCMSCNTFLSPRTTGFLSYFDSKGRANCKLSPDKILQIIFHWALQRKAKIGLNFLLYRCQLLLIGIITAGMKLGDGNGTRVDGQTPNVVIQIDECLLRGQRMLNRGRLLQGDESIDQGDRAEWNRLNTDQRMHPNRNYGMRIRGPWIFGLV
ncbi:hypothetical protein RF11_11962 [Thelohanellus kitauei]|uniref:Uncharacterized protein n=1 Tax=Thelohanellus kitauei TaxID=669202 RepID=A0A0C2MX27_THEKT|nr:hypothetical protein RF11_11962 [Thelohanellus kitauei]